jgi:tryptophanyl-tRNA synthetase
LPTFKEKVKQYPEHVTMALLNYPVLMAADILIYKASMVPVGIDQEPHLEVAREIARKMNAQYGLDFPEPQRFATSGEYVPSLTGLGKMSKTVEGSYINLSDSLDEIKAKLARVPTDSGKGSIQNPESRSKNQAKVYVNPNSQEVSGGVGALMRFVELFQGKDRRDAYEQAYQNEGLRYGDLKAELAEAIYAELEPIQQKRKELESQPGYVDQVIMQGAQKARVVAEKTVFEVKQKMGLA